MAFADVRWEQGTIYFNPTDIDNPGTQLGVTLSTAFVPATQYAAITAEEWGGATAAVSKVGDDPVLIGILSDWSDQGLQLLYPGAASGASGTLLTFGPYLAGAENGKKITPVEVLFVPNDTTTGRYTYLPAAIPMLGDMGSMQLRLDQEINISFSFKGTPAEIDGELISAVHGLRADVAPYLT